MLSDFDNALLFKTIVEQGSLTKAAVQWNINASAASKRLNKLETSMGTQLINRTTRRLILTEAGQYFYDKVKRLSHDWQAATEETISFDRQPKGTLKLAVPQPVASRFLMPAIAKFRSLYPNVQLHILHQAMEDMPSADADISICREIDSCDSNSVVARPFFQYRNTLFASPNYLAGSPKLSELADIKHHQCLIYSSDLPHKTWSFEHSAVVLENTLSINNAEIMISAATHGMGLAYIPKVIIQDELTRGDLVPILPKHRSRPFNTMAYYLKADFVPQKVRVFVEHLRREFQ